MTDALRRFIGLTPAESLSAERLLLDLQRILQPCCKMPITLTSTYNLGIPLSFCIGASTNRRFSPTPARSPPRAGVRPISLSRTSALKGAGFSSCAAASLRLLTQLMWWHDGLLHHQDPRAGSRVVGGGSPRPDGIRDLRRPRALRRRRVAADANPVCADVPLPSLGPDSVQEEIGVAAAYSSARRCEHSGHLQPHCFLPRHVGRQRAARAPFSHTAPPPSLPPPPPPPPSPPSVGLPPPPLDLLRPPCGSASH
jgi:hypothetical protein